MPIAEGALSWLGRLDPALAAAATAKSKAASGRPFQGGGGGGGPGGGGGTAGNACFNCGALSAPMGAARCETHDGCVWQARSGTTRATARSRTRSRSWALRGSGGARACFLLLLLLRRRVLTPGAGADVLRAEHVDTAPYSRLIRGIVAVCTLLLEAACARVLFSLAHLYTLQNIPFFSRSNGAACVCGVPVHTITILRGYRSWRTWRDQCLLHFQGTERAPKTGPQGNPGTNAGICPGGTDT